MTELKQAEVSEIEDKEALERENSSDEIEQISDEIKGLISGIAETIKQQNQIIAEQQKKIEEQDKKINDIIGVLTALLQNTPSGMLGQSGVNESAGMEGSEIENQNIQENVEEGGEKKVSATESSAMLQQQRQTQNPLSFDRVNELLKSIAIITSNMGGPRREEANPVGSIHQAIDIASSIAGAFGEGLSRIFEAFNQMEERAFKSYAARFKSIKFDDSDIEKAVERAIEKKLKFLVKEDKTEE